MQDQGNVLTEEKTVSAEERILAAALEVVSEKTISGTRMHLIAAKAGLAQANLHYYFKTKKDLLVALLRHIQKDFVETRMACMGRGEKTLAGQLGGFFEQKKGMIQDQPQLDRVQLDYWSQGQVDEEINQSFQESYAGWRSHIVETVLLFDPEDNREKLNLVAGVMVSMMMGASLQCLNDPQVFDIDAYFETCNEMVLLYIEKAL